MDDSVDLATDVLDVTIGDNLRRLREARGLSQKEFAVEVSSAGLSNFHQTTVARIENGTRPLRVAEAVVIARLTDTSIERLIRSGAANKVHQIADELSDIQAELTNDIRDALVRRLRLARELDRIVPMNEFGAVDVETMDRAQTGSEVVERADELLQRTDISRIVAQALAAAAGDALRGGPAVIDPERHGRREARILSALKSALGDDGEYPEAS